MSVRPVLAFAFALLVACKSKTEETSATADHTDRLAELYNLMQGSFNSEKQSAADTTYYNISLHMYPIWKEKGYYLYVEQAMNSAQDRPYRQRIYEITSLNDSLYASFVYTIKNDSLWIGKWQTPKAFDTLSPADIEQRNGCAVFLRRIGEDHFKGSTKEQDCESSLRGASYATSIVEITQDKIESWDQGFNAEGEQVWGATEGGYVFDKLN